MLLNAKSERFFLLALGLFAFLLRLGYIFEYRTSPFFYEPIVDAQTFLEQALQIAAGDLWGGSQPFWQPPLYPYWLALFCWLSPDSYYITVRLAQTLLGSLSCIFIYLLARRVLSPLLARSAAIIAALYSLFIYFDGELLAVPVEVFLNLLLIYSLLQGFDHFAKKRYWLQTGLIGGLCTLTRPNILLFLVLFPFLLAWFKYRSGSSYSLRSLCRPVLFVSLPILLLIAPVTLRNYHLENDLVFISSNGGVNFYLGNNAAYDSTVAIRPGKDWELLVAQPLLAGAETAATRSDYFFAQAYSFMVENPGQYAWLLVKKIGLFWSGPELKRNHNLYYTRDYSIILRLLLWAWGLSFPFGLLGPLSIWGLIATWRSRSLPLFVFRSYTLLYMTSVVLFFVVARYRIPAIPILIIFAVIAIADLAKRWEQKNRRQAIGASVAVVLLTLFCNQSSALPPESDAQLFHDLGEVHLRRESYGESIAYSKKALVLATDYPSAHHNLAVAYLYRRNYRAAINHARQALALYPQLADTRIILAQAYTATGFIPQALHELEQALALVPASASGHYYYGRLLLKQGFFQKAIPHLEKALLWKERDFWVLYELAQAHQSMGQLDQALAYFRQANSQAPQHPAPLNAIGAMYLIGRDYQRAKPYFEEALKLAGDNIEALVNLGFCELHTHQYTLAIDHFKRALPKAATPQPILQGLLQAYLATGQKQQADLIRQALE
ncbi:MAG: tetratricopeptide repeat protein [Candidatus Latescibacteria bacterium]|nr:tetratricopeptide repeat protein [Candidatus Latescibacterota bacterium]